MRNTILTGLIAVVMMGCGNAVRSGDFQRLSEKSCVAYAEAAFKPALPIEWQPYLASTRICSLVKNAADKAEIMLVSISLAEATERKQESDPWDKLPKPVLINENGQCVAKFPYLYPDDPPFEIQVSYGLWQEHVPGEIRLHVLNQAIDGDFDLPTLIWNKEKQRYDPITAGTSSKDEIESMRCGSSERN